MPQAWGQVCWVGLEGRRSWTELDTAAKLDLDQEIELECYAARRSPRLWLSLSREGSGSLAFLRDGKAVTKWSSKLQVMFEVLMSVRVTCVSRVG